MMLFVLLLLLCYSCCFNCNFIYWQNPVNGTSTPASISPNGTTFIEDSSYIVSFTIAKDSVSFITVELDQNIKRLVIVEQNLAKDGEYENENEYENGNFKDFSRLEPWFLQSTVTEYFGLIDRNGSAVEITLTYESQLSNYVVQMGGVSDAIITLNIFGEVTTYSGVLKSDNTSLRAISMSARGSNYVGFSPDNELYIGTLQVGSSNFLKFSGALIYESFHANMKKGVPDFCLVLGLDGVFLLLDLAYDRSEERPIRSIDNQEILVNQTFDRAVPLGFEDFVLINNRGQSYFLNTTNRVVSRVEHLDYVVYIVSILDDLVFENSESQVDVDPVIYGGYFEGPTGQRYAKVWTDLTNLPFSTQEFEDGVKQVLTICCHILVLKTDGRLFIVRYNQNQFTFEEIGTNVKEVRNVRETLNILKNDGTVEMRFVENTTAFENVRDQLIDIQSIVSSTTGLFGAIKRNSIFDSNIDVGEAAIGWGIGNHLFSEIKRLGIPNAFRIEKIISTKYSHHGLGNQNRYSKLYNSHSISIETAFAILLRNGTVVTFGTPWMGGDSSTVAALLEENTIKDIFATSASFAALTNDGKVVCWGLGPYGGNCPQTTQQSTTDSLVSTNYGFGSISSSRELNFWGKLNGNGELIGNSTGFVSRICDGLVLTSSHLLACVADNNQNLFIFGPTPRTRKLLTFETILSVRDGIALLENGLFVFYRNDGEIFEYDKSNVNAEISKYVSTFDDFALLYSDGQMMLFSIRDNLDFRIYDGQVKDIVATRYSICFLTVDGNVDVNGKRKLFYDTSSVSSLIRSGNTARLFATWGAIAALQKDGSVVTFGYGNDGGNSFTVQSLLKDVTDIHTNTRSFVAETKNNGIVCWGNVEFGGDCSTVDPLSLSLTESILPAGGAGYVAIQQFRPTQSPTTSPTINPENINLFTFGDENYGADSSLIAADIHNKPIESVHSTLNSFLAVFYEDENQLKQRFTYWSGPGNTRRMLQLEPGLDIPVQRVISGPYNVYTVINKNGTAHQIDPDYSSVAYICNYATGVFSTGQKRYSQFAYTLSLDGSVYRNNNLILQSDPWSSEGKYKSIVPVRTGHILLTTEGYAYHFSSNGPNLVTSNVYDVFEMDRLYELTFLVFKYDGSAEIYRAQEDILKDQVFSNDTYSYAISDGYGALFLMGSNGDVVEVYSNYFSKEVASKLYGLEKIVSVDVSDGYYFLFAAKQSSGSVLFWGLNSYYGNILTNITSVDDSIFLSDVKQLTKIGTSRRSLYGFGVLKNDGTFYFVSNNSTEEVNEDWAFVKVATNVVKVSHTLIQFVLLHNNGTVTIYPELEFEENIIHPNDLQGFGNIYDIVCSQYACSAYKNKMKTFKTSNYIFDPRTTTTTTTTSSFEDLQKMSTIDSPIKMIVSTKVEHNGGSLYHEVNDEFTDGRDVNRPIGASTVLLENGKVVTFGTPWSGGDSTTVQSLLVDVKGIYSTAAAFALMTQKGSVICWGCALYGGECDNTQGVTRLFSNKFAFVALNGENQIVKSWGDMNRGGDTSYLVEDGESTFEPTPQPSPITIQPSIQPSIQPTNFALRLLQRENNTTKKFSFDAIESSDGAFAGLTSDGLLVRWGDLFSGGYNSDLDWNLVPAGTKFRQVISGSYGFSAITEDGLVYWFLQGQAAKETGVVIQTSNKIKSHVSTKTTFAAILEDDSLVVWGLNSSFFPRRNFKNVRQIVANHYAINVLHSDSSVTAHGEKLLGGDATTVQHLLDTGVKEIVSNYGAFCALKNDGSVVSWGYFGDGGDSSLIQSKLKGVKKVYASTRSFIAQTQQDVIHTWGMETFGGGVSTPMNKPGSSYRLQKIVSTGVGVLGLYDFVITKQPTPGPTMEPTSRPITTAPSVKNGTKSNPITEQKKYYDLLPDRPDEIEYNETEVLGTIAVTSAIFIPPIIAMVASSTQSLSTTVSAESVSFGQFAVLGGMMVLPSAPTNYVNFASSFYWTTFMFIPLNVGENDDENEDQRRLDQFANYCPAHAEKYLPMAQLATLANITPRYMLLSCLLGLFLLILIFCIGHYFIISKRNLKYSMREAVLRLICYGLYPIAVYSGFTLRMLLDNTFVCDHGTDGERIFLCLLSICCIFIVLFWAVHCVQAKFDFDSNHKVRDPSYAFLFDPWKEGYELFWLAQAIYDFSKGIFVGMVLYPTPIQACLILLVTIGFVFTIFALRPHKDKGAFAIAVFISIARVLFASIWVAYAIVPQVGSENQMEQLSLTIRVLTIICFGGLFFNAIYMLWRARKQKQREKKVQKPHVQQIEMKSQQLDEGFILNENQPLPNKKTTLANI